MFDPHRTRRSDRRYYTRKGQVLQASRVNTQPIIEQRLVDVYKKYLLTNGLIAPPPAPPEPIGISGISVKDELYSFSNMTKYTTPTVHIAQTIPASRIVVLFYIDTSDNSFCQFKYKGVTGLFEKTIEDNKVCYFAIFPLPSGVTNEAEFNAAVKGILDASASNYVISTNGNNIYIKNDIPLTPV